MKLHCRLCGGTMQKWGKTKQGKPRFFCTHCKKTATPQRDDVELRDTMNDLRGWLGGKESLSHIAASQGITRQALWKRFHHVMDVVATEPEMPNLIKTKTLIVDGTYIHGRTLCALIAVDETDKIYWKFVSHESYTSWCQFLSSFVEPEIIIMDGQKGLFAAAKALWSRVAVQRCQFHLVAFAMQYIGRRPKERMGRELMDILYKLKEAKTPASRELWLYIYRSWEQRYETSLAAKDSNRKYIHPRLRGARLIIRRALPYLFTFLHHPGAPNTTNLVEGWINGAIAEAVRLHRGVRIKEKKALATIILSDLTRPKQEKTIKQRLVYAERIRRAKKFGKRKIRNNIVRPDLAKTIKLF